VKKALFLDRDGTLIKDTHYLHKPAEVQLIAGTRQALEIGLSKGYELFLFTNQSGIGRGFYTREDAVACNEEMIRQIGIQSDLFSGVCIAPETPDQTQIYRKPSPKFILEMIEQHSMDPENSWMLGDRLSDLQAAHNAKIQSAFLHTGKPLNEPTKDFMQKHSIPQFPNLLQFVETL